MQDKFPKKTGAQVLQKKKKKKPVKILEYSTNCKTNNYQNGNKNA